MVKVSFKKYTAKEVHADLTAMMLLFLEDIQQEMERKSVPQEVLTEKSRLDRLGFKRAKNTQLAAQIANTVAKHNKIYDKKKAALEFMHKAWATFGKDTMIVRYEQFLPLLEKYNLVCGSFDRYTGTIPAENLADIERVMNVLEDEGMDMTEPFRYIKRVDADYNNLKWLEWFNLYPLSVDVHRPLFRYMGLTLPLRKYHAKPLIGSFATDNDEGANQMVLTDKNCHVFIAAPSQEMEDFEIEVYSSEAIKRAKEAQRRRVRTYDPFICSLTPYGVMIYTKWGDEAQDDIIKRYEELRDAVIGKGGAQCH